MTERLIWQCAADIEPEPLESLLEEVRHMPGFPAISRAIGESEFADSHEHSHVVIIWRYCHDGMAEWLAVLGIRHGYSSPSEWRRALNLHKRLGIRRSDFAPVKH